MRSHIIKTPSKPITFVAAMLLSGFMCAYAGPSVSKTTLLGTSAEEVRLVQTIPLPKVEGRIDHLSVDLKKQRLFVAALGNNTLEILDLNAGKVIKTVTGLSEPQDALYIPELNKIYVANGGSGVFQVFDGDSFKPVSRIKFSGDADNINYAADTKSIYVGYGNGAIGIIESTNEKYSGDIMLDGHPEGFKLEQSGSSMFINIPSANQIAVVDRKKRLITSIWPIQGLQANYPMALDESNHRLFVGFWHPAKLNVYDTKSGSVVASLDSVGDVDNIFYDAKHKRIYLMGGEGYLDIFEQKDANQYQRVAKIPTAAGARTGLLVPELNRLFVAVPHRGNQQAEIRVYALQP